MKKLTGKQIIQKLTTNCTLSQIAYMDCDYEELGLGEVEEVEQVGDKKKKVFIIFMVIVIII